MVTTDLYMFTCSWPVAESVTRDAQVQKAADTVSLVRWGNGRAVTEREKSH